MSDDTKKPGWQNQQGQFIARPEHVKEMPGPRKSQNREVLSKKLVQEIRDTDPNKK